MRKFFFLAYGLIAYAGFLGVFCYAAGFLGNFLVPKSIDSPRDVPLWQAFAVNSLLLGVFAVQHSVMARPAFKRWWTRYVPEVIERSTYVLISDVLMIALFVLWQPMGGVVWDVHNPAARMILYASFAAGCLIVVGSSFAISHFDLFGMRQVWLYFRGKPYTTLDFAIPGPYRYVRHPLYVGWFLTFWATPTMTAAHLLFATLTGVYMLVAIRFEERDLVAHFGEHYARYREQVPMLVPTPGRRYAVESSSIAAAAAAAADPEPVVVSC
jgi:protein-S-isoprenylcysteine O-methyltransferase Ste14